MADKPKNKAALLMTVPTARIAHSQQRYEMHGDEKVPYMDVSLTALLPYDVLDRIYPDQSAAAHWKAFYWGSNGAARPWALGTQKIAHKFDNQAIKLFTPGPAGERLDEITVSNVRVRQFRVTPEQGFDLTLAFQVQMPVNPEVWEWMEEALQQRTLGCEVVEPRDGQPPLLAAAAGGDGAVA